MTQLFSSSSSSSSCRSPTRACCAFVEAARGLLARAARARAHVSDALAHLFERHAVRTVAHPLACAVVPLLLVAALGGALVFARRDVQSVRVYVPRWGPGSGGFHGYERTLETFGVERGSYVLLTRTDGASVLGVATLRAAFDAHALLLRTGSGTRMFRDVCVRVWEDDPAAPCAYLALPQVWNGSVAAMEADPDRLATLSALEDVAGLGGVVRGARGEIVNASAIRMTYFVSSRVDEVDYMAWEWDLLEAFAAAADAGLWPAVVRVQVLAERSMDDELDRIVYQDTSLVVFSIAFCLVFMSVVLGRRSWVGSKILLGCSSIVVILVALLGAFGLGALVRVDLTPISPLSIFVLVGIGVDGAIIVVDAVAQARAKLSGPAAAAAAGAHTVAVPAGMSVAGPTLLVATLTNLGAFGVGSFSSMKSVANFCITTAIAILFVFALQCTAFLGFLVLDARREESGRADVLPCVRVRGSGDWRCPPCGSGCCTCRSARPRPGGILRAAVERFYTPVLLRTPVRLAVVAVFVGMAGVSLWAILAGKIETGIPVATTIPDGSYYTDFFREIQRHYTASDERLVWILGEEGAGNGGGATPDFVADGPRIRAMLDAYGESGLLTADVVSWLHATEAAAAAAGVNITPSNFLDVLSGVLHDPATLVFRSDLIFDPAVDWTDSGGGVIANGTRIVHARFSSRVAFNIEDAHARVQTFLDVEAIFRAHPLSSVGGWMYCRFFPFSDAEISLGEILAVNLLLAGAAISAVLLFFVNPVIALLVGVCVIMIDADLVGAMALWDLPLEPVSYLSIVMSLGLSVDYCAHLGVHVSRYRGPRADSRAAVAHALNAVGVSVLNGGVSTILGIAILVFASSEAFLTFFKMLLTTVLLGLVHGLVFFPALVSLLPARILGIGSAAEPEEGAEQSDAVCALEAADASVATPRESDPRRPLLKP